MNALRSFLCLVIAAAAAVPIAAEAQSTVQTLPGGRSYLGLNVNRTQSNLPCASTTAMLCDDSERSSNLFAGKMIGSFWGAEVGVLNMGRLPRDGGTESRAQGLNLSLVGRTRLGPSIGLYGKLGTTYGRTETALTPGALAMNSDHGFGLSWAGGLSYEINRRWSATLEVESHDFRFGGGRDPVRSTNLGLQFRY